LEPGRNPRTSRAALPPCRRLPSPTLSTSSLEGGTMKVNRLGLRRAVITVLAASAALIAVVAPAYASSPTPQTLYQLPSNASCTKSVNNCVLYPKAAALPSGRLVAAFEESTVTSSGSANGQ